MIFAQILTYTPFLLLAALALPMAVQAQTVGQAACPDGVMQKNTGLLLSVSAVEADKATLQGLIAIDRSDIQNLSEVTGNFPSAWNSATLYFGVRGYGYPDGVQDARKVPFTDGDLVHGFWAHSGTVNTFALTPRPITFLSLEPSTKYVAQIVAGEFRKNVRGGTQVVTNDVVGGTANSVGNKPKPVIAQVCFQTAASGS